MTHTIVQRRLHVICKMNEVEIVGEQDLLDFNIV